MFLEAQTSWNEMDVRATLHQSLRALTHDIQIMWLVGKLEIGPSSFYTRPQGFEELEKFIWMKTLRNVLHGTKWIIFHGRVILH
jgi:hypothetical protein